MPLRSVTVGTAPMDAQTVKKSMPCCSYHLWRGSIPGAVVPVEHYSFSRG